MAKRDTGPRLLVWTVPGAEVAVPRERTVGKGKRRRVIQDEVIRVYTPYTTPIHQEAYKRAREIGLPPQAVKMEAIKWRIV